MKPTGEAAFETAIEAVLLTDGYRRLSSQSFDRERAIFPDEARFMGGYRKANEFAGLFSNH